MDWFNTSPTGQLVKSFVKVYAAVVLGLFLADGADVFAVDATDLRTWAAAALAAALPLVITAIDPTDNRFGVKSLSEEPTLVEEFDEEGYKGE